MVNEEVKIKAGQYEGTLVCYEHEITPEINFENRPAMVVIPGGGYCVCSKREGEPVALEYFNRGYNAYVLYYPCAPARYPAAIAVAAAGMDTVRKRATAAKTDPKRVFAIGFSAGGHLCACLANGCNDIPEVRGYDFRPNGVVLAYPVISEFSGHPQSYQNLLGDVRNESTAWLELHTSVRADNPPAFIWVTADDNVVNSQSSFLYAQAYAAKKLPYELHVFKHGPHGLSLCDERTGSGGMVQPAVAPWIDLSHRFLMNL